MGEIAPTGAVVGGRCSVVSWCRFGFLPGAVEGQSIALVVVEGMLTYGNAVGVQARQPNPLPPFPAREGELVALLSTVWWSPSPREEGLGEGFRQVPLPRTNNTATSTRGDATVTTR